MFKLVLEKAEEPEIKLPTYAGSSKKQESSRKISTSPLLTVPKPLTGEGNGNPLQYCCLENPMDRGVWWATVHGVTKSRTQLSIRHKPLTVWTTTNWKILKEMGIPGHLTYLLRNLYAGQEAAVRTGHGITDWFQIRKGVHQGCILSPCLFNLYADYIMRNAGLEEAQAGIKIAGRNIKNLRYADDTKVKRNSKAS